MATISLKNVSKKWAGFTGVDALSLDIADGEFLVLLGPSGCGKTTTMRMIAGLETITSGEIWIGDRVVNDLEPKDRDIAVGVPVLRPLSDHVGLREHPVSAPRPQGTARDPSRTGHAGGRHGREPAISSSAVRLRSRAVSASAWRSPAQSFASRPCS